MGINLTEMKPIVGKAIEGGLKQAVLSISPYMLESSGAKVVDLNEKLYYGAFGSVDLYQTYFVAIIRHLNLMPAKFPKGQINAYGVNKYSTLLKMRDVSVQIDEQIGIHKNDKFKVDSVAIQELKDVVGMLERNNVKYIIYFHPIPARMYQSSVANQVEFRQLVKKIVPDTSRIVDFNTHEQLAFTTDLSNYIDQGHLSDKGQKTVMDWLYLKMRGLF